MELNILTGDFESFYSDEYSLRKMTPAEYICDPRWECIGMAARMDRVSLPAGPSKHEFSEKARWVDGPALPKLFEKIDWSKTAFMSHNVGFDGAILAWRYGIVPALYIDTLGMARAMLPMAKGASLEKVLQHIGAPPKGDAIKQAKGLRRADLMRDPAYWQKYKRYAERDDDGCFWIFEELAHGFAGTAGVGTIHRDEELLMMDTVARMAVTPQLSLDWMVLVDHHKRVVAEKEKLVAKLRDSGLIDPTNGKNGHGDLQSGEKFANLLRGLGVEPPTKISLKTGKESYAFSKTDEDFTELLEHEDPLVQAAVAARLGVKSTIEETRTQRFINIASIRWPVESNQTVHPALVSAMGVTGPVPVSRMPFPLKYSGAHTHRLSGDWSLNLQNLGRKSPLRAALLAPPGMVIVSADASQIEARIVSWLAGCVALVDAFARGIDVYSVFAGTVYGYLVNKNDHPVERFVGKTGVLGLGFGMGPPKFVTTCWNQSQRKTRIDLDLAQRTVKTYRSHYKEVPAYWRVMDSVIHALATRTVLRVGVLIVDGPTQSVILPNGMRLYYENMRKMTLPVMGEPGKFRDQWVFEYGRETKYTFGGKMTENVVQALAKIITMNAHTRIRRITGKLGKPKHLAGQVHDQLIYLVPEQDGADFLKVVLEEMSRALDWFSTLPLAAEGGFGINLLEIK